MPSQPIDPQGACPACDRAWKDWRTPEPSRVIRLFSGSELRAFQCPWCAGAWKPDGTLLWPPAPEAK